MYNLNLLSILKNNDLNLSDSDILKWSYKLRMVVYNIIL